MKYAVKTFTVYIDGGEFVRKFRFFINVSEGYTFKIVRHIQIDNLQQELRCPKYLVTTKPFPANKAGEEVHTLIFSEYNFAYDETNSIIELE